ncbi:interleukin-5 isoform X1 [Cynocephalus volans]|uniref:interleukin-5 isoform X1 n=1 Tax=Cynocephalus volans TaxID=110931 RepID=UPI002FC96504
MAARAQHQLPGAVPAAGLEPGALVRSRRLPAPCWGRAAPRNDDLVSSDHMTCDYAIAMTLRIPVPVHKNHQLCTEEIFQGIDTLKNQTVQRDTVEKLFQNLSLIKKYIDLQKKKCGEERRRVKQFLDYLQEFLGIINTEWTMEN